MIQQIDGGNKILDQDIGYYLSFLNNLEKFINENQNQNSFIIKDHPRMPQNSLIKLANPSIEKYMDSSASDSNYLINSSDIVISHIGIGSVMNNVLNYKKKIFVYDNGQSDFYLSKSFASHNLLLDKKIQMFKNFNDINSEQT